MSKFANNKLVKVTTPLEDKSILLVELNRGPANAFNQPFWEELGATFDAISRDYAFRAVVLSSTNPKIFTTGIDFSDIGSLKDKSNFQSYEKTVKLRDRILHFQSCLSAIERCNHPVIAAVNGTVSGLGIDIMCVSDIRYSSSKARFSIKVSIYVRVYHHIFIPTFKDVDIELVVDSGTLSRLPNITRNESLLRELTFTAREFGPSEATQLGMVSRVVEGGRNEVVGAALELAKMIAKKSSSDVTRAKRLLFNAHNSAERSLVTDTSSSTSRPAPTKLPSNAHPNADAPNQCDGCRKLVSHFDTRISYMRACTPCAAEYTHDID
ncbi:unnamed protein product [Rhizoctonia solani]|uniref:ClpP/crotonase n=1 Tax=Rhizoctonia solani TaxID=456999 RepID=A0A8H3HWG4_9AGAM|nr:unnamed protein product [Rhizoctonia solani]